MLISHSVGRRGINRWADVKTVQIVLNLNLGQLTPMAPLAEDGSIGGRTIGMIEYFEQRVMGDKTPSGRVEPSGPLLQRMKVGMTPAFDVHKLAGIMINAGAGTITTYYGALVQGMAANAINTPMRMAHFLAQLGHESGDFRYPEELASGDAYEGRVDLGNTQPGDGPRFKGRGLIQITGRANYTAYGAARKKDYTTHPNQKLLATDPFVAVDCSCWYWATHGLNDLADLDDVESITRAINGGLNGFDDRKARLARAKFFLVR